MAVDLARAKQHLRVDFDDEDALIDGYLKAAVAQVETMTGRLLTERGLTVRFDRFTDRRGSSTLELAAEPVVAVATIDYVDADGVAQVLTLADGDYRLVLGEPSYLLPPIGGSWPTTADQPGAVTANVVAGFGGTAGDTPEALDQAVLMLTAHFFENREAVNVRVGSSGGLSEVPLGVQALCWPFRRNLIG